MKLDHAHGPCVGIGKYGLSTKIGDYLPVFVCDLIQGFVPGNALEFTFALGAPPFERMQNAQRGIYPLRIVTDLYADRATGEGVRRITLYRNRSPVFYAHQETARIRAIMGAH
jgi:hypothetical protein